MRRALLVVVLTLSALAASAPARADVRVSSGGFGVFLTPEGDGRWRVIVEHFADESRNGVRVRQIGIAWSGPFEHLLEDAWSGAAQWFPGLLLEALAAGGTADVSVTRSLVLGALYVAAASSAAAVVFARRDITG